MEHSALPTLSQFQRLPSLPVPLSSSFLPPFTTSTSLKTTVPPLNKKATITCSSKPGSRSCKIVRCPPLDHHAARHSRLRFVRKLTTLLLSKPRHFLPLRILARCRPYLSLPPSRPLLPMLRRYPAIFHLFRSTSLSPDSPFASFLAVGLTPAAESLAVREAALRSRLDAALADKLHRLLMLASGSGHRLVLSKLVHIGPDLGFPPNFRSRLCNSHPGRFRTVETSYGRALELVSWESSLAVPFPSFRPPKSASDRIIDRPPKFKNLALRRGLNLKRRHRDYLIHLQELPEVSPYANYTADDGKGEGPQQRRMLAPDEEEKRACAVVREVLGMTVEKRTLVDHLTHFRKEFGLPNRLRAMLVRHPEMFYVSVKGVRDSVFLVEAYDDKGKLLVEDELLQEKGRLMELVREGKRMRRERKRDVRYGDEDGEEGDDDSEEADWEVDEDDDFVHLFETGIGDDWEEITNTVTDDAGWKEVEEFWIKKAAAVGTVGVGESSVDLEAW